MKLIARQHRERLRAIRKALNQHGFVRAAADALGMPKSTFFDAASRLGLCDGKRRKVRRG